MTKNNNVKLTSCWRHSCTNNSFVSLFFAINSRFRYVIWMVFTLFLLLLLLMLMINSMERKKLHIRFQISQISALFSLLHATSGNGRCFNFLHHPSYILSLTIRWQRQKVSLNVLGSFDKSQKYFSKDSWNSVRETKNEAQNDTTSIKRILKIVNLFFFFENSIFVGHYFGRSTKGPIQKYCVYL